MSAGAELERLFQRRGSLLLDFDGPVCSIFAGYTAPEVADGLRAVLVQSGIRLPRDVAGEADPLAVLRWVPKLGRPDLVRAAEDWLRAAEMRAAATAEPTHGSDTLILTARQACREVAIVSNNSAPAIMAYLRARGLEDAVAARVGRIPYHPELMKPDPTLILTAIDDLGLTAEECVFVGDSVTDVLAGDAAGVSVIGYANKPGKEELLRDAGAGAIVTDMATLTHWLDPARHAT